MEELEEIFKRSVFTAITSEYRRSRRIDAGSEAVCARDITVNCNRCKNLKPPAVYTGIY
jgi:hypothetical protein